MFIATECVLNCTYHTALWRWHSCALAAIFENYVAEIRLDGKPVQLALWDTACVVLVFEHPDVLTLLLSLQRPGRIWGLLLPLMSFVVQVLIFAVATKTVVLLKIPRHPYRIRYRHTRLSGQRHRQGAHSNLFHHRISSCWPHRAPPVGRRSSFHLRPYHSNPSCRL